MFLRGLDQFPGGFGRFVIGFEGGQDPAELLKGSDRFPAPGAEVNFLPCDGPVGVVFSVCDGVGHVHFVLV